MRTEILNITTQTNQTIKPMPQKEKARTHCTKSARYKAMFALYIGISLPKHMADAISAATKPSDPTLIQGGRDISGVSKRDAPDIRGGLVPI